MFKSEKSNLKKISSHKLHLAVLATLPVLALTSINSYAACAGSIASPVSDAITVECSGTGATGNISNTSATDFNDTSTTATAGNNTLIQFDGQGRKLTNTGNIINDRVITGTGGGRARTAVLMGAATLNAGAGTVFAANLPATGATTVILNAAPTTAYVGQTVVFGRFNAAEGDFAAGVTRIITAVDVANKTITFADALPADFAGTANTDPVGYKVVSNYGVTSTVAGEQYHNVVINSGTISSKITAAEINANKTGSTTSVSNTAAVKAITMSVEGDYIINNSATGIISVKHDGIGSALAIEEGGAVESLTVNNKGLISAERTAALTLVDNTATANPTATAVVGGTTYTKQTVALVNAINTQEEAEEFILNNAAGAVIRSTGDYAGTIYMRAASKTIVNDGLIEQVGAKGFAIGAVSDPGSVRTFELTNSEKGVINGDILAVNGNALRWYLLSTEGGAAGLDARLNITSQYGQSDSTISNAGRITGNFYYSNGTHVLTNEETGVISGNIDVDQRNTTAVISTCTATASVTCPAASVILANENNPNGYTVTAVTGTNAFGNNTSTTATVIGTKDFTFENAGDFSDNLTILTASSAALNGAPARESQITLKPTVIGSGAGSTQNVPSTEIAGLGATLKVWDGTSSTIATTTTLAPIAAVPVKTGEWFKVSDTLFGTDLPTIENSALVNWTVAKNASGNLVIGVDSVNSASSIAGVTGSSASTIEGLLTSTTAIGGLVQGLTDVADINKAGLQLSPEANGASLQATISAVDHVSSLIGAHQDATRVASNGSGVSTGEAAQGVGFWMQGFGFKGQQGQRGGIDGYDADTGGFVLGGDKLVGDGDLRVGAAVGYATTGIDGRGVTSANKTDIDSYQGTVYGSWNAGAWYVDAALGYGRHTYDTKRFVALTSTTLNGDHHANQYLAKIGGGYPIAMGKATLTPLVSATYMHLDQSGYTEKDPTASGAALTVSGVQNDSFRTGLGAKVSVPLSEGALKSAVEARAIWNHEFADANQDIAARFAGGTSFTTNGISQARDSANLGLGVNLSSANGQTLSVTYDAEVKSDYIGHTATVKFRYDF